MEDVRNAAPRGRGDNMGRSTVFLEQDAFAAQGFGYGSRGEVVCVLGCICRVVSSGVCTCTKFILKNIYMERVGGIASISVGRIHTDYSIRAHLLEEIYLRNSPIRKYPTIKLTFS